MVWRCLLGNHYVHVKCLEGIMIMLRVILLSALTLMVSAAEHYCAACHGADIRGQRPCSGPT